MTHSTEATKADQAKTSILIKLWPVYVIAGGLVLTYAMGWNRYFTSEGFLGVAQWLDSQVQQNLFFVLAAFVAIYIAATVFIVPASLLTIFGGSLFGLYIGAPAIVVAATIGASILFFASKSSIGSVLRDIAGPFLEKMEKGFREDSLSYMFALRLIPIFPFAVVNIAPALLGARYRNYLITTFFGIIPGTIAYTWIGSALRETILAAAAAGDDLDIGALARESATNFIPAFIALGVVALIPIGLKRVLGRKSEALQAD